MLLAAYPLLKTAHMTLVGASVLLFVLASALCGLAGGLGGALQAAFPVLSGVLLANLWVSMKSLLLGFVISCVIAIPLGYLMGLSRITRNFFDPLVNLLQAIPGLAWEARPGEAQHGFTHRDLTMRLMTARVATLPQGAETASLDQAGRSLPSAMRKLLPLL